MGFVGGVESGRRRPPTDADTIQRLAQTLQVPVSEVEVAAAEDLMQRAGGPWLVHWHREQVARAGRSRADTTAIAAENIVEVVGRMAAGIGGRPSERARAATTLLVLLQEVLLSASREEWVPAGEYVAELLTDLVPLGAADASATFLDPMEHLLAHPEVHEAGIEWRDGQPMMRARHVLFRLFWEWRDSTSSEMTMHLLTSLRRGRRRARLGWAIRHAPHKVRNVSSLVDRLAARLAEQDGSADASELAPMARGLLRKWQIEAPEDDLSYAEREQRALRKGDAQAFARLEQRARKEGKLVVKTTHGDFILVDPQAEQDPTWSMVVQLPGEDDAP